MVSTLSAHGVTVSADNGTLVFKPSPLRSALSGTDADRRIPAESVSGVSTTEGDAWNGARSEISHDGGVETVEFAPGDSDGPRQLAALVEAARGGESSAAAQPDGIPGLDFVAFDVETANPAWGSICQMGLVKVVDGAEVERASWLCTPPPGMDEFDPHNVSIHGIDAADVADAPSVKDRVNQLVEFIGDLPIVAHNAQFDATALRDACRAVGRDVPDVMFACTLALSRAEKLDVANHRLPTLAEHFGYRLDNHHDACEDAAACAAIMVGLASSAGHAGSLMGFVHSAGFTLGVIGSERVTPVLRDRSGAGRAAQARAVESGSPDAAAAVTPRGSNQHEAGADGGGDKRRGSAPWQSVATPDTVPEPNPQADPDSPLYGHNVTLTGEFEPYDKGTLWSGIADQGATVGKNVTKKTTILVTGEWASTTSKEKRARELMEKGQDIEIWPAERLLSVLGLDEEPPF